MPSIIVQSPPHVKSTLLCTERRQVVYAWLVDTDDAEVAAAVTAARAALDSVLSRPDDPAKFRAISLLSEGLRHVWEAAAAERPAFVRRYRDREKLALAPLARQLSTPEHPLGKTRVHQLYEAARKDPEHV